MRAVIVVLTTNGDSREDGNVFYADYCLVVAPDSSLLDFSEPELRHVLGPGEVVEFEMKDWVERVRAYGYEVRDDLDVRAILMADGDD